MELIQDAGVTGWLIVHLALFGAVLGIIGLALARTQPRDAIILSTLALGLGVVSVIIGVCGWSATISTGTIPMMTATSPAPVELLLAGLYSEASASVTLGGGAGLALSVLGAAGLAFAFSGARR